MSEDQKLTEQHKVSDRAKCAGTGPHEVMHARPGKFGVREASSLQLGEGDRLVGHAVSPTKAGFCRAVKINNYLKNPNLLLLEAIAQRQFPLPLREIVRPQ